MYIFIGPHPHRQEDGHHPHLYSLCLYVVCLPQYLGPVEIHGRPDYPHKVTHHTMATYLFPVSRRSHPVPYGNVRFNSVCKGDPDDNDDPDIRDLLMPDWDDTCMTPAPLLPDAACSCAYDGDAVGSIVPAEVTCPTTAVVVPVDACRCCEYEGINVPAKVTTAVLT